MQPLSSFGCPDGKSPDMLFLRYSVLVALVTALVFFTCKSECPPDEEPVMKTSIRVYDRATYAYKGNVQFRRIYGLGGKGDVVMNDSVAYLPLSLHADSVTYVFESDNTMRDTLILFYNRDFGPYAPDKKRCGFGADFNGSSYIHGSNDTLRAVTDPRFRHQSRTTFAEGSAQFRESNHFLGNIVTNIYKIELLKDE